MFLISKGDLFLIDSEREKRMNLGREWTLPKLNKVWITLFQTFSSPTFLKDDICFLFLSLWRVKYIFLVHWQGPPTQKSEIFYSSESMLKINSLGQIFGESSLVGTLSQTKSIVRALKQISSFQPLFYPNFQDSKFEVIFLFFIFQVILWLDLKLLTFRWLSKIFIGILLANTNLISMQVDQRSC